MLNKPSIDPANEGTLTGTFRHVFTKLLQGVDGFLPCRVVSFNGNRNSPKVTVKPLIAVLTTEGQTVSRGNINSVPVLQMGAGGFLMSYPINVGDLGWIMASDRDISLFVQSYKENRPNTNRIKSFADAVFIPDVMRGYNVTDTGAVWQSLDGSVKIALSNDTINLTAPNVTITSDTITHNGVDIGAQHRHSGSGGNGIGGTPI